MFFSFSFPQKLLYFSLFDPQIFPCNHKLLTPPLPNTVHCRFLVGCLQETHMLLDQLPVLMRAIRAEYVLVSLFVERREIWTGTGGKAAIPTDYRILKSTKATFPSSCSSHWRFQTCGCSLIYIIFNVYIWGIKSPPPQNKIFYFTCYLLVKYTNKFLLFFLF